MAIVPFVVITPALVKLKPSVDINHVKETVSLAKEETPTTSSCPVVPVCEAIAIVSFVLLLNVLAS